MAVGSERPTRHAVGMTSTVFESTSLESRSAIFSALGDPIRLRILDVLADGERCVCTLQESIEVAPNLLSYHLRVLREAGLVISSRRGRWIDYSVADAAQELIKRALPPVGQP